MNTLIEKLKALKHKELYIAIVLCAVILLVFFLGNLPSQPQSNAESWNEQIEKKITAVISDIDKVGQISIAITYESGIINEYAYETKTVSNSTTTTSTTQIITSKGEPLIVAEHTPRIKGVVVVAEGASDIEVRMRIIKALVTLLDIDSSQIEVFTYKK